MKATQTRIRWCRVRLTGGAPEYETFVRDGKGFFYVLRTKDIVTELMLTMGEATCLELNLTIFQKQT